MAEEPNDPDDIQAQLTRWMEAAQKPQPPLGNSELLIVREIIKSYTHRKWLRKQIFTLLPWITSVAVAIGGGWNWLVNWIKGP